MHTNSELTLFTTVHAFHGQLGKLQKNAIYSWCKIEPKPKIILFGDVLGAAEFANSIGATHIPTLIRNSFLSPRLDFLFHNIGNYTKSALQVFVASDTLLAPTFYSLLKDISSKLPNFLAIGQPNNIGDIHQNNISIRNERSIELSEFQKLSKIGTKLPRSRFFAFSADLWRELPPLALGNICWSNYLPIHAILNNLPVIDVTEAFISLHQEHSYRHTVWGNYERLSHGIEAREQACLGPEGMVAEFLPLTPYIYKDAITKRQNVDNSQINEAAKLKQVMIPRRAIMLREEGMTLDREARSDAGLIEIEKALRLDPNSPGIHIFRSVCLLNLGRYQEAEQAALRHINDAEFKADALRMLDMIKLAQDDPSSWNTIRESHMSLVL